MTAQRRFEFTREEPGFCRLYFRAEGLPHRLYCLHYGGRSGERIAEEFLSCSSDGEPDTPFAAIPARERLIGLPADVRLPGEAVTS